MKWLISALLLLSSAASAHEWYEQSCCSDSDCAPVSDGIVEDGKEGVIVKNFGILSYTDPRLRWSRDNQDHLCVSKTIWGSKLLCVYRKPKGM